MPSLNDFLRDHTSLPAADVEWLRLLVGDWQLLSDLSFADLVLWVDTPKGWLAVAHVRATTGPTVFLDDVVGSRARTAHLPLLDRAVIERKICRGEQPDPSSQIPARDEAIAVVRSGDPIAVLTRHTQLAAIQTPSALEVHYLECGDQLAKMVAEGSFPVADAATGSRRGAPRVGDGLICLDEDGCVTYASPNAVSAYHRFGHDVPLVDRSLAEVTTGLLRARSTVDEGLPLVLLGKAALRVDIESSDATLSVRSVPLRAHRDRTGAVLLVRDVTELRRRERELISKDATIREIHHRVKNNLQTVAALLRLQARRVKDSEAGTALRQAERRVAAIAWVHETLSTGFDETVDFGDVASTGLSTLVEVARPAGAITTTYEGRFGRIRGEDATALSLVLTELVQNAAEHGLSGRDGQVRVVAQRIAEGQPDDQLIVTVSDDGVGLPNISATGLPGEPNGLGGQIVRALVSELRGTIDWRSPAGRGTEVTLSLRPRPLD